MKENLKVINFHIKVGELRLSVNRVEKYTINFYFENYGVGIKTIIANL